MKLSITPLRASHHAHRFTVDDLAKITNSQKLRQAIALELAVFQNLAKEPGTYGLAGMDRHDGGPAIGVSKEMMASLDPQYHEPGST